MTQQAPNSGLRATQIGGQSDATWKDGKKLFDKVARYRATNEVKAMGIYPFFREIETCQNPVVKIGGQDLVMMGSNNYLGLVSDPRVIEAAQEALKKFGTGCAGSRLLNGTLSIHEEAEQKLAKFVGKEAALLYSTGYQANLGAVATLMGRHDTVVLDKRNHASIVDAVAMSRAQSVRFKHNDIVDFEKTLAKCDPKHGIMVIVDGVFSMEGDVAPLPDLVKVCKKYNAVLVVDDAHGLGVLGKGGRGTSDHFGVTNDVDVIVGTFSKSLASIGGFVAADQDIIDYLRHHSRAMIFSASMPPASVASVLKALEIMQQEPERIEKLWFNTNYMKKALLDAGFNLGHTTTPILPVMVGDDITCFRMCSRLHQEGVFVNPVPGLSSDVGSLIRLSLMATHETKHIDFAMDKMVMVAKELGVL